MPPIPRAALAAAILAALAGEAVRAGAPADAYGDPLPPGAVARLGSIRLRQAANGLAWAPDSRTLATAGADGWIHVWDAGDGREARRWQEAANAGLSSIVYLPDGKSIVALGLDGAIHVWDAAAGREVRTVTHQPLVFGRLAAGPDDGTVAVVGGDGACRVLDLTTAKAIRTVGAEGAGRPNQSALSADGRRFAAWAAAPADFLTVWETAGGKELVHAAAGLKTLTGMSFSSDGKVLALFDGGGQLVTWDVDAGKELRRYGGTGAILQGAFSPDGKYFAGRGADQVVRLWGLASGMELRRFEPPPGNTPMLYFAGGLAFSPDGKVLAVCQGSAIRLWDVEAGAERDAFTGHAGAVDDLRFSPDGRRLLSCGKDGAARLWDVAAGRQLVEWPGPHVVINSMAATPDARAVLAATGVGLLRADFAEDKATDRVLARPAPRPVPTGLAASPDGKSVAGYGGDRFIHLWDTTTGKDAGRLPIGDGPGFNVVNPALAFSPDGRVLAAATPNGPVHLLDVAAGSELRQLDAPAAAPAPPAPRGAAAAGPGTLRGVVHLSFSPDGRTVLCVTGGELSVWEAATGRDRMRMPRPGVIFSCAAFSPAGDLVAAGTSNGTVLVLDARTDELARLEGGHGGAVAGLAFAPDGKTLASGGADGGIVLWAVKEWAGRPTPAADIKPENLPGLWKDLIDGDSGLAYRAVLVLAASPKTAAPYLKDRLAGAPGTDEKRIAKLIVDLNDDAFDVREAAQKELDQMGEPALPALRQALESNPPPETRRRVAEILAKHTGAAAPTEDVRRKRAVEALERSGAPEAMDALRSLAKGAANAGVRQEAEAALDRLALRKGGS